MTQIKSLSTFLQSDSIKERFSQILGNRANGFLSTVLTAINQTENLKIATTESVYQCALMAAALDLSVNPNLGQAYLIAYKNNKTGITECQFQIGYKGLIQLAQRSGQFKQIEASPIYEGELVKADPLFGYEFDFSGRANNTGSKKVIGYASYFKLLNGFEKIMYMSNDDLKDHGLKYSQNFKKFGSGLWKDNFDAMAIKTVLKLNLGKFAPLSVDMQKAIEADQSVIKDENTFEYVDNTPLSIEEQNEIAERTRIAGFIEKATSMEELEMVEGLIDHHNDEDELSQLFKTKKRELK